MLVFLQTIDPVYEVRQPCSGSVLQTIREHLPADLCGKLGRRIGGGAGLDRDRGQREGRRVGFSGEKGDHPRTGFQGIEPTNYESV